MAIFIVSISFLGGENISDFLDSAVFASRFSNCFVNLPIRHRILNRFKNLV